MTNPEPLTLNKVVSRRTLLLSAIVMPVLAAACAGEQSAAVTAPSAPSAPNSSPDSVPGTTATTVPPTTVPALTDAEFVDHLMRRSTYGPTKALAASITAMGATAWIDQQLSPDAVDDETVEALLAQLPSIGMDPFDLRDTYDERRGQVISELTSARFVRAMYSERQLYEMMVAFWTDHFNIDMASGLIIFLKGRDEQEVIRPHALGRFSDMLIASAKSPAMLLYLDNSSSRADGDNVPNENYARELLELHTVGVDGGYDEEDIAEVAHVLSGWTIDRGTATMRFAAGRHSMDGVESVLGWKPQGLTGQAAGESLIDHLAHLPETAIFLATKLCRRFVADDPPQDLIDRAAAEYLANDTEIAPVMRLILTSDEFAGSSLLKVRRPLEMVAAHARVIGVEVDDPSGLRVLGPLLRQLGEPVYTWPTPDGPPDVAAPWINAGTMIQRWNISLSLAAGDLRGSSIDIEQHRPSGATSTEDFVEQVATSMTIHLDEVTLEAGRILLEAGDRQLDPTPDELADLTAVLLASPAAQRR